MGRFTGVGSHVDDQIGALAGAENEGFAEPLGLRQWHPVQRDGPAFHSGDINDEDPRVGRIDQTQSKPFILTHIDRKTVLSVRRNEISHAACVAAGMRRGEVGIDLCGFGIEKPIVQDQNLLAIHFRSFRFLNNQRAVKPGGDLFEGPRMGVIPIGSGIRYNEVVIETLARFDGGLGQPGDAVHRVVDPDSVPVDRACLWQRVQ